MTSSQDRNDTQQDYRRTLVLVASIVLLIGYVFAKVYGFGSSAEFAEAAMGRIGLVLAALWLAWPSLQRPAQWVPPGIAMLCLFGLVALAAQPNLRTLVLPAIGALIAAGVVVKALRSK